MQSLLYVKGSDGAANASQMTVTTIRAPGATTILTNTVSNVPTFFYGSMGAPHTFTDPVTGEVITVISDATAVDFAGTVTSGYVDIVAIAPGYVDTRGSLVGDIIVVRPITEWANNIYNVLNQSLTDTGVFKTDSISSETMFADPVDPVKRMSELGYNCITSGGIITADAVASTRNASMTALVGYINGQRGTVAAVTARAYTASKDTYVDVLNTAGVFSLVYTEVTNNAASPALAANSIRLGTVVTGASNIAATTSIGQGGFANIVPVVATQTLRGNDSLGNVIYPKSVSVGGFVKPKFSVYLTGSPTSSNSPALVPHNNKLFDTNNNVDITTNKGRFTCTVAGYYFFNAAAGNTIANANINSELFKNGVRIAHGNYFGATTGSLSQVTKFTQLQVGDYVEHWFLGGSGSVMYTGADLSYFEGWMISAS